MHKRDWNGSCPAWGADRRPSVSDGGGEVASVHGSVFVSRRLVFSYSRHFIGSLVRDGREEIQGALPCFLKPQERSGIHLHPEPQPSSASKQGDSGAMGRPTAAVQIPAADVRHEHGGWVQQRLQFNQYGSVEQMLQIGIWPRRRSAHPERSYRALYIYKVLLRRCTGTKGSFLQYYQNYPARWLACLAFASDDCWIHGYGSFHHSLWLDHWRFGLLLGTRPHALCCRPSFPDGRYLLHHFSLHMRCWHQLWTVSLPALPVRPAGWYKSRLRLVYVQCLGRTGADPHSRVLLHPGTVDSASPTISYLLPQVSYGERKSVLKTRTYKWHMLFIYFELPVMKDSLEDVKPRPCGLYLLLGLYWCSL